MARVNFWNNCAAQNRSSHVVLVRPIKRTGSSSFQDRDTAGNNREDFNRVTWQHVVIVWVTPAPPGRAIKLYISCFWTSVFCQPASAAENNRYSTERMRSPCHRGSIALARRQRLRRPHLRKGNTATLCATLCHTCAKATRHSSIPQSFPVITRTHNLPLNHKRCGIPQETNGSVPSERSLR